MVDAAIFENNSAFGIGLVARDSAGGLLQARTKKFQGQARAEFAEAIAIKEALSWCMCSSWSSVIIESDCLVVVQAIRSSTPMLSHFGGVIEECRKVLKENNNFQLYFIKRSANMAAHELARASYSFPDRIFDRGTVPIEVDKCIVADLMS
ncbi:uncharacterized protein LOC141719459 [Apium graveolens]|uniref:uncharacterized protein LOC141719459 n=1 Tax=Apium graveolens TaxID=4045 RepID=UPI003D792337